MRVTRQQFLQIQTALLDGYDRTGLRRLVRLGLDVSLDDITIGTTDSAVVFDLIEWAERCDKIQALIQAAVEHYAKLDRLDQAATELRGAERVIGKLLKEIATRQKRRPPAKPAPRSKR